MARPRSVDYEKQRDLILHQAVRAFARMGYASAGMAELAQRCQVSKATLYHYYPNKEAILFDALNRHTSELQFLAESVEQQAASLQPEEALRTLLRAFMSKYRDARDMHLVLLNCTQVLQPEQRKQINANQHAVVDVFGRALQRCFPGVVQPNNQFALSMTLLSALNFSFAWLRESGPLTAERYADWVADLWLKGVNGGNFAINTTSQTQHLTEQV